jgi:hypothetical protein
LVDSRKTLKMVLKFYKLYPKDQQVKQDFRRTT